MLVQTDSLLKRGLWVLIIFSFFIAACTAQEAPTGLEIPVTGNENSSSEDVLEEKDTSPAAQEEVLKPAVSVFPLSPGDPQRTLKDSDSSIVWWEKRTISGDNFQGNLYERPFTSQEMAYLPYLDIYDVDFSEDEGFFYFDINLYDLPPEMASLPGNYGIEFDQDLDGRGDLLVWVTGFGADWSTEGVAVFKDEDNDVGGELPLIPDTGFSGSGYEAVLDFQGTQAAFARQHPDDPASVQLAVSKSLLESPEQFLWGAWADDGEKDVAIFDFHDFFNFSDAGSPIKGEGYPLKELHSLDNTCRLPYGFAQMGAFAPGMCVTLPPRPSKDSGDGCQVICYNFGQGQYCFNTCDTEQSPG